MVRWRSELTKRTRGGLHAFETRPAELAPPERRSTPAEHDTAEPLRLERETARLQNRHGAVQAESRQRGGNTFFGGGGQ
jgi:hypothetical protein